MNIITNYNGENKSGCSTINRNCKKPEETKAGIEKVQEKRDILDIFSEKVVNKDDIKDMVTMPRTIFKGYLCFTTGTMINGIAQMIKNLKIKTGLMIAGSIASIYGTYNFVKPYLIKEKDLTKSKK